MTWQVQLDPSGASFDVEEGETILQAGLAAGHALPFSCRSGICRTCIGVVTMGEVDVPEGSPMALTEGEIKRGCALLCQARPLSDVVVQVEELSGMDGLEVKVVPCRVRAANKVAADVVVLSLALPPNENFRYLAGQFIDVLLKDGKRRSYSIATKPEAGGVRAVELHIRYAADGLFTSHVFNHMKARELLTFEGPLGSFYIREDIDRPILMIASGTGFAPLKAMCEAIFDKNINANREVFLYWGGRRRADLYMSELPESWMRTQVNMEYVPVLSEPSPECNWSGRSGFVHQAVLNDFADLSGFQVYACGAPPMVEAARKDFIALRNLHPEHFFSDSFLTESDKASQTVSATT